MQTFETEVKSFYYQLIDRSDTSLIKYQNFENNLFVHKIISESASVWKEINSSNINFKIKTIYAAFSP